MELATETNSTQDLAVEFIEMGAKFSPVALIMPEGLSLDEWADVGKKLCRAGHVMNWWIADWAAFGEKKWGKLKEFARLNGLAEGTIYNLASVARGIETSRRREDLSIGHHEAVAALSPKEQVKWLTVAHEKGLTRSQLRSEVRKSRGESDARDPDGPASHWPQDKPVPELTEWLTAQPEQFWTEQRREWWKAYLRPLVTFFDSL